MSDPIEAWVDGAELRRMGELLVAPVRSAGGAAEKATKIGGQPQAESDIASQHLARARELADRGGVLACHSKEDRAPKADSSEVPLGPGPLLGRLTAYRDWLHQEVGVRQFFLLEESGETIVDEPQHEGLRQLALRLARSAGSSGGLDASGGSLRVQVNAEFQLEVITAASRLGKLVLGLLVHSPLSPAAVKIVAEGLQKAVAPR